MKLAVAKPGLCMTLRQTVMKSSLSRYSDRHLFLVSWIQTSVNNTTIQQPLLFLLQVGDIITSLESVDDEWFLGDLRGKRALVPKNYVQVLE